MKKMYTFKELQKAFLVLGFVFCALFSNLLLAQKNIGWTGAVNNDWTEPGNWNYPAISSVGTFPSNPELNPLSTFDVNSQTIVCAGNLTAATSLLKVDATVSGVGIAPGTTVTAVAAYDSTTKTTTVTLSANTTAASAVEGNRINFKQKTELKLTEANDDIAVGDKVSGYGIPAGTLIEKIDSTKKIITIGNTYGGVGTPGTNLQFTFATPKTTLGEPSSLEIALISNGGNPTLPSGQYTVGGIILSNDTGAMTGSTLTIPNDVIMRVQTSTNEGVLIKGGNIVNNGILEITSSLSVGSNNHSAGAFGITCGLPSRLPLVATEYTYSGTGSLEINTSAGTPFSGGFYFNGVGSGLTTYKFLFNGSSKFVLSSNKTSAGASQAQLVRAIGIAGLQSCKVIFGGKGFDLGSAAGGGVNGLVQVAGVGVDFKIAQGTTINVYCNSTCPMPLLTMYAFGSPTFPSFITNQGTLNFKGELLRSPISVSSEGAGSVNIVNDGLFDVDVKSGGISVTNNQNGIVLSEVNIVNNGTFNIRAFLNGAIAGTAISTTNFAGQPNLHITNTGTFNVSGSSFNNGSAAYNPASPLDMKTARITNSGIINTNQEFRQFYTVNAPTGVITFAQTPTDSPNKITVFTVLAAVAANAGSTYTDELGNIYTIPANKVSGTGTALSAQVSANAITPPTRAASVGPPVVVATVLTKTSGTGDATIPYTAIVTTNNNAFFQPTVNSGVINTNTGTTKMTGINGVTTPDATSVISPGGDSGKGIISFNDVANNNLTLNGTLKIQVSGNTTAGVDYDFVRFNGQKDKLDITTAILDVTGIYTPAAATTIDLIVTNNEETTDPDPDASVKGSVIGSFASVKGLTTGWTVNYITGKGGKVQLVYDTLSNEEFAKAKFVYYPNPTRDFVNISAAKNISKVAIYNLIGQKVQTLAVNANEKQVDISNLKNGVYLMEVTIDNKTQSFKIVKK